LKYIYSVDLRNLRECSKHKWWWWWWWWWYVTF